jgi:type IV pilus assembly protein PilO
MNITLTKLPWYAQIGAFVMLAVAGVGAFYYYYERPFEGDMHTRQQQLVSLRADISKGLATAKQLPQFEAQVNELQARLNSLKAVLPDEKDAADLLRQMQTVAVQSNLVITNFRPQATIVQPLHAEWPIQLGLQGTYHNLATFFDRIGRFTRIINISNLDVKAVDKPDPLTSITANCTATTFVLVDSATAADAAPQRGARGGGRGAGRGAPPARRGPVPARGGL